MSINVKIPACILPDIAQFIIYKKLMLRKKKDEKCLENKFYKVLTF